MPSAKVKWFDPKKGYGFLIGPEADDIFIHYSQIKGDGYKSLDEGDRVEFEVEQGPKGLQARNIKKVE